MGKKVLLVDDDPDLGRLVEMILRSINITVYQSFSGKEGLKKIYEIHPDLVILDIMMPEMNGFDVCVRLREMADVPVLMLTARCTDHDILHAFNVGADDFIKKPFNKNEFEARVRALLRRSNNRSIGAASYIFSYEDTFLNIDLNTKVVKLCGKIVELSPREYSLLAYLVREQGKIISNRELMRDIWGEPVSSSQTYPSLYVYYLRKRLQDGKYGHKYIHTHRGRGYWFEPRKEE